MEVRPIGVLSLIDDGDEDDKVISVQITDPVFSQYNEIEELPIHTLLEFRHFFETYKGLENKTVEVRRTLSSTNAKKMILKAISIYNESSVLD